MRLNPFLQCNKTAASQLPDMALLRYRLILTSQSRTVENIFSMGFVEVRVFLSNAGTFKR